MAERLPALLSTGTRSSVSTMANRTHAATPARGRILVALLAAPFTAAACGAERSAETEAGPPPPDSFFLDFSGAPEAAGPSPIVAARRDGSRFAVAASSRPSAIVVFDERGRYVEAVGRRGPGPGELGRVSALAFDATDSLWVFGSGRVDIWSPDFEPARSMPLRGAARDVAMAADGGRAFVAGSSADPALARVRVRLLSRDGDLSPLERESGPSVSRETGSEYRSVAASERGYWVANFHEWDVRHLDLDGDTLAHVSEPPEWWRPFEDEEVAGFMDTSPAILDIGLDESGHLWVLSGIPIPDREALQAISGGDRSPHLVTALADHVLRVYDSSALTLLSERRFDYFPLAFVNRTLAAAAVPTGDSIVVSIYSLESLR